MKYLFLYTAAIILSQAMYCQQSISGKVIDVKTREPLAFANIIINGNQYLGVRADIDGKFRFDSQQKIRTVACSYIGYAKKLITIVNETDLNGNLIIELDPLTNELSEVIVHSGDNPANRIIRKVIANREINDPENISSFSYETYNKIIYDFTFSNDKKGDSIKIIQKLQGGHLLIVESATERRYLKPGFSSETVTGTRVSGFKNPSFVSLATDLQPFSFYGNNIELFGTAYLNPVSRGSTSNYSFSINDTLFHNSDTTFVISFRPAKGKSFEGLSGVLYINTNKYAIQNVIASPYVKGKIELKIQQQYALTGGENWFPEQLNYVLMVHDYPAKDIGMAVSGRSYINNVQVNIPLVKSDFPAEVVTFGKLASSRDSLFWQSRRNDALNIREKTTYRVIDSIGEKHKFGSILLIAEKVVRNRLPVKFVDIDISRSLIYNEYEGLRLGFGLFTNEKISDRIALGGSLGYGVKDNKWKYGGEIVYDLKGKNEFRIGVKHYLDLAETGQYSASPLDNSFLNVRNYMASQMDEIKQSSIFLGFRALRYATFNLSLGNASVIPRYSYAFQDNSGTLVNYVNTELSVSMKYTLKEKIVNSLNQNISMGSKYPVVFLKWSKGIKDKWKGDLDYNKFEGGIEQTFFIKKFGKTRYRIEAGYCDRPLPAGLLFTGEGAFYREFSFHTRNTFVTMKPYEFLSDTYTDIFFSHNFGSLLFNIGKFAPDLTIHNNIGWGRLAHREYQQMISFKTQENVYCEAGLQFDNIIKINYLNLGYLGLGAGAFCRYGNYSYPELKDNLAFTFNLTYTIK